MLFALLTGMAVPAVAWLWWPSRIRVIIQDLRIPRILFYWVLAWLGAALWWQTAAKPVFQWQGFLLLAVCLIYAAVFAIVTNNLEDLETDKLTNPGRPLVRGVIQPGVYLRVGIAAQLLALVLALWGGRMLFFSILLISSGYYLYSCRPFKLKKYPFLAKMIIGFNGLTVSVYGYTLAGGEWNHFPFEWMLFILIPVSLSANFVDLKDTEGDRVAGVRTLPVVLGEARARQLIAFFTAITYGLGGWMLHIAWLYPVCAVLAVIHIFLLYKKPYNEKPVFVVFILALIGLSIFSTFKSILNEMVNL